MRKEKVIDRGRKRELFGVRSVRHRDAKPTPTVVSPMSRIRTGWSRKLKGPVFLPYSGLDPVTLETG